ncbi:adhesion G protein-coupled receptor F5 [Microcaecilia unicolor]|uniref:Adhesion G protein-coupled receptor F5 n=1 Tax=Microcaecilia unicolor TaxID=1415580 RepID=A0A6P7XCN9_9AMPH|nr:adhesion G protein-coupled receptor F5 [Microcaecilia unicolor]
MISRQKKMEAHWILFCSAFFLPTPYQDVFSQESESWVYSLISTEKVSSTNLSRQKRAVTSNTLEYVADLEISFSDPQFLVLFRNFLSGLELPIADSSGVTIQNISITTVCNTSGDKTQCSCGSGYAWPTDICTANPPCSSIVSQDCSCISKLPLEGQYCQLTSSKVITVNMSITIQSTFTEDFKNPSSRNYMDYKIRLEAVFNKNYKILPGFISATVTGFRNGSIIADYSILTESFKIQDIEDANNLTNFTVSPDAFFDGDDLILRCETETKSVNINWFKGSTHISGNSTNYTIYLPKIQNGVSVSVLKINHITSFDQGIYTCKLQENGIIYEKSYNISVPLMTFNKSIDVDIVCNGIDVKVLKCCREGGSIDSLNATWITGSSAILGTPGNTSSCFTYTLRASEQQCRPERSGEETTYKCEIKAGNVIRTFKEIKVKFYRNANVTISSKNRHQFSVGEPFSLTCTSDTNAVSISWEIIDETTKEVKLVHQKYYNSTNKTSVLNVTASMDWKGIYRCNVSQAIVSNFANTKIMVFPLPLQNEIIVYPRNGTFKCTEPTTIKCCAIGGDYDVKINIDNIPHNMDNNTSSGSQVCYIKNYTPKPCPPDTGNFIAYCRFNNKNIKEFEVNSSIITMTKISANEVQCDESPMGIGKQGGVINVPCQLIDSVKTMGGNLTYTCINKWQLTANNCIPASVNTLLSTAQRLIISPQPSKELEAYLKELRNTTQQEQNVIQNSTGTLGAVVEILSTVSQVSDVNVTENMMENFLSTVNTIVENNTINTWNNLNNATSSLLLKSVENFARELHIVNSSISITGNENVQLQGITVGNNTSEDYNKSFHFSNSTGNVFIELVHLQPNLRIVSIAYSTLKDILPKANNTNDFVNGLVMSTVVAGGGGSGPDVSISMTFSISNPLLHDPKCVFWNFNLSNKLAGWDKTGCQLILWHGDNVNCVCNHSTPFSILMSPVDDPSPFDDLLSIITYIGLGISLGCLVLCIIIEALVWKSVTKNRTSYMRHVCFVNIAVSLLVADIWFIIGAIPDIYKYSDVCVAITFFSHLFYLSLFFWMLTMALKLLYLLIYVFQDMSKSTMMTIAFSLGYGCPLIISVITIAVTQPAKGYMKPKICWLKVNDTKAFLAFVAPALTIVAVNFIISLITIIKILRPSIGDKPRREEKSTLVQIAKSIAILTPLLGLTWGFGLGVTLNDGKVLRAIFAALNSLQGFFIFAFVTLWDRKVREALMNKFRLSKWPSLQTKSTSESSAENPKTLSRAINALFGKTGMYKISSAPSTSLTGTSSDSHSLLK